MRLSAFLELPGQRATDIARKCGVAVSTITRVAKGEKRPSMDLAEKIRAATNGAVSADDFLPPFEPAARLDLSRGSIPATAE
ncbi:helix-turn-helix transcriptional regulator [Sphingomonas sp. BK069]|uniref:helix-turn-helix domain-containing protein n=1 Tax=Sphingomonas sp. BK069 TaxID=2586979 RepID=UPI0016135A31|nr:helix-turn-helix transcriptional regulator [Sphingomonas sp. BK069]